MVDKESSVNSNQGKKLLKDIRKQLGFTQAELATMLGSNQAEISRFETGKEIPDWFLKALKLQKILSQAGASLDSVELPPPHNEN